MMASERAGAVGSDPSAYSHQQKRDLEKPPSQTTRSFFPPSRKLSAKFKRKCRSCFQTTFKAFHNIQSEVFRKMKLQIATIILGWGGSVRVASSCAGGGKGESERLGVYCQFIKFLSRCGRGPSTGGPGDTEVARIDYYLFNIPSLPTNNHEDWTIAIMKPPANQIAMTWNPIEERHKLTGLLAINAIRKKKFYKKTDPGSESSEFIPQQRGHMKWQRRRETHLSTSRSREQEKNQMGLLTMDDGIVNLGRSPYGVVDATKRGTPTRSEEIFSEGDGLGRKDWEELRVAKGGASTEPDAHQCLELILVVQMLTSVRSRKPVPTKTSNSFSPKRPHVNQFNQRRFTLTQSQSLNHPLKNTDRIEGIIDMDAQGMTGTSEVTNNAGTSQTPNSNASEEKDEDVELIVVPSAVKITEEKVESRTSSTNSKKEEILTEPQQEKKASSTDTSEDNPKILAFRRELEEIALKHLGTVSENNSTSTPSVNTGSQTVNTGRLDPDDSPMPELEIFHKSETGIFDEASYDEEGVITDFNSLPTEIEVSPTPTLRIHNIHPKSQILGDPKSAVQTRSKVQQKSGAHALFSYIQKQQRNNHKDQQHCLFACFLSQEEPKKIAEALQDDSWVQAMQEELLQFKLQQVWVLVDLPHGMKVIGTKWVYKNKEDEKRGMVVRNKACLGWLKGYTQEEGYKSQNKAGIFISQDKYVAEILKKFDLVNVKTAITPMETKVALTKDEEAVDVDVHLYRSMIGHSQSFTSQCCGSNLDRKSTTGGCQFLGQRLISWQCKKQTIVATSTTEVEYVAAVKIAVDMHSMDLQIKIVFGILLTAKPLCDGTLEIHATIDTTGYTITEASIRDKLQLADASGITMLPNDEIFEGMGQMGILLMELSPFGKAFSHPNGDI
ncbi:hypothetical protein Tco_1539490 [Tanacetum coccineum]